VPYVFHKMKIHCLEGDACSDNLLGDCLHSIQLQLHIFCLDIVAHSGHLDGDISPVDYNLHVVDTQPQYIPQWDCLEVLEGSNKLLDDTQLYILPFVHKRFDGKDSHSFERHMPYQEGNQHP